MSKDRKDKSKKQRLQKQHEKERHNELLSLYRQFSLKVNELLGRLNLSGYRQYLSESDLQECFLGRTTSVVFNHDKKRTSWPNFESLFKSALADYTDMEVVWPTGVAVTYREIVYYLDIVLTIMNANVKDDSNAPVELKSYVKQLLDLTFKGVNAYIRHLNALSISLSSALSNPKSKYFLAWMDMAVYTQAQNHKENQSTSWKYFINYEYVEVPTHKFEVDGKWHVGYRVATSFFNQKQRSWVGMPATLFGLDSSDELELYVQSHALIRLSERLDVLDVKMVWFECIHSINENPVAMPHGKSTFYIPVVVQNVKLGYFVASVINRRILLRTFLFITNSSTPEGIKLDRLTGLNKLDKTFLRIDKLSSFFNVEMEKSPEFIDVFTQANLTSLVNINPSDFCIAESERYVPINPVLIESYIKRRDEEIMLSNIENEELLAEEAG